MRASLICIRGNAVTRHTMWALISTFFFSVLTQNSSRPKPPAPWQRDYRLKDPIKQLLFEPEVKMVVEKAPHALSDLRDLGWMVVETSPLHSSWPCAGHLSVIACLRQLGFP